MRKRNGTLRAKKSLSESGEVERILKYIPFNVRTDIAKAPKDMSKRDMLRVWLEKNQPQFMILFNTNYDYEIDNFIEIMSLTVRTYKTVSELQKEGALDDYKPVKKRIVVEKTIKAKRGKTSYTRTASVKFENKKFLNSFIKIRLGQGKSLKIITKEYNTVASRKGWNVRTVKSIENVKYREKLHKK